MAQLASLIELQKYSAVPNFVHIFNVLHADYLALPRLDIDEYEYSLLPADDKLPDDVHDPTVLPNIVIKLLKGCGQAYVREDTCFDILRSLTLRKWHIYANPDLPCPFVTNTVETAADETLSEEGKSINQSQGEPMAVNDVAHKPAVVEPLDAVDSVAIPGTSHAKEPASEPMLVEELPTLEVEEIAQPFPPAPVMTGFHDLPPALKAEIMLVLLNAWMMGHLIKTNFIDNIQADLLRITPCGHDQRGNNFFYFFGTRLYKESNVKHDPVTGTDTFQWELVASQAEDFTTVLAGLKKLGVTARSKALLNQLENVIVPGLAAFFEEKHQNDLQRRMEFRRRRSAALQLAKEKAKLERQEAAAARMAKRVRQEDDGEWSEKQRHFKAASRAERYKRRSQLIGQDDQGSSTSAGGGGGCWRDRYDGPSMSRGSESKEDLIEKARRLLMEWLTRQTVQWPLINVS